MIRVIQLDKPFTHYGTRMKNNYLLFFCCCLKKNLEINITGRKILGKDGRFKKFSFLRNTLSCTGPPRWLSRKEYTCHCRRCKRYGFDPWIGKIPWRRKWQPTPVFLPGESHGQRSLKGNSPWGCKESDMTKHTCTSYIHDIKGTMPYILYIHILLYIAIGDSFLSSVKRFWQTCFHFTLYNIKMLPHKP